MPETSYIMQIGEFLNIDTHEWLSIGYTTNHAQATKLKQSITHHGIRLFGKKIRWYAFSSFICYQSTS